MHRFLLILASFAALEVSAAAPEMPLRIATVGDSTMCEYPADRPDRGWGQYIEEHFRPGTAKVVNTAAAGRSTKTFIQEGRWEKTLQAEPSYIFIQFGHNDSHDPKNRESTDPAGDYKENLRRYIDDARAIGATPILVTPVVRRRFDPDGKFDEAPTGNNRPLGSYAAAMREVGTEKKVPVIDLYSSSMALVARLGPIASAELANRPGDPTHFNEKGARAMADLVFQEIPRIVPDLARYLKAP